MKTEVQTPMEVFLLPQHLVIPLFQRPYVWSETEQWAPLWQDIRRLTELRLNDPFSSATHFLGAVVIQAQENQQGHIPSGNIIDGQQRLTTLQILADAAALVFEESGLDGLAGQLESLTHNQENFVIAGDSRLKLQHTNKDHAAFVEVMNAEPPVVYGSLKHAGSLLVKAHDYFTNAVSEWLGSPAADGFHRRADALVSALLRGLQLVVINLTALENSQEIFETLNARGTPLTAADLIKNFVFQKLAAEGRDTTHAYAHDWPFDTKFWEVEVSVGRHLVSRSSLFLNQWLVSRTGEEVGPQSTFTRFKTFVELESGRTMTDLLPLINAQAALYESWLTAASDENRQLTAIEMAVYRMQANKVELLQPILIWLHAPDRPVPASEAAKVVALAESWLVRRQLLRLTGSDLGRIVADIIRIHREAAAGDLALRVQAHLARLNVLSTYWPGDDEIREALAVEPVYRRFQRGRLRMLLEAIEDRFRNQTNQPQVPRRGYPIEHVLPQKWDTNWRVDGVELEHERAAHVHRLGNLTLLTSPLNSKVSNGPWDSKRESFKEHDTLLLTSRLLKNTEDRQWDEVGIDTRTAQLIDQLLEIWPIPEGHTGDIVDPQVKDIRDWVEIKHLVAAGLLEPGTKLSSRPGRWGDAQAIVQPDGQLEIDSSLFSSPSGAGRYVRGASTNGWYFWRLPDGRTLKDVRAEFTGIEPIKSDAFDWSALHALLEQLPAGRWTSYGQVASVIGTAAQPLGQHISSCGQCTNVHRVLKSDGSVASNFSWAIDSDEREPVVILRAEGITIENGMADPNKELISDELAALIENRLGE